MIQNTQEKLLKIWPKTKAKKLVPVGLKMLRLDCNRWRLMPITSPLSDLSTLEKKCFQNDAFPVLKSFSKFAVSIGVFLAFSRVSGVLVQTIDENASKGIHLPKTH